MKQKFIVTGMTCSACSAHVDKAVRKLAGVSEVNVNLLSGTMTVDWQGDLTADDIIAAVVKSGYGASLPQTGPSSSEVRARPAAHAMEEDLKNMRLRLIWSLVFLIPLFYLSMGHMMGWPIPAFFHGTENAMVYALTLFLLTVPTLIINQKYFRVGFKTLFHLSPNMDSLIAVGSAAAVVYGVAALYFIGWGLGHGDLAVVERYSMDLYFESAAMIVTLITVGKYARNPLQGQNWTGHLPAYGSVSQDCHCPPKRNRRRDSRGAGSDGRLGVGSSRRLGACGRRGGGGRIHCG